MTTAGRYDGALAPPGTSAPGRLPGFAPGRPGRAVRAAAAVLAVGITAGALASLWMPRALPSGRAGTAGEGPRVLAYAAEPGAAPDLWLEPPGGGAPVRLTDDPAPDFSPVWSPDRTRVAFLRGRADEPCRLMVIALPPDDVPGPEREIARCPAAGPVTLSWTGGHGLAVTSAPGGWGSEGWPGSTLGAQARRAVAQFGSAAKAAAARFAGPAAPERAAARAPLLQVGLAAPAPRVAPFARPDFARPGRDAAPPDRDPAWSPDGRTLAYVAGEPGAEEIWLAPADGPPRRLTRLSAGRLSGLAWSPDGRRIAAVAHAPGGAADLVVADALTGTAVALTDGPAPEASPAWSADGRRLHFAAERGGVWRAWRMEPHAGAEAEPVSGPGVRSVRSDAAHLYLRRADGAVSRRPHAGGEEEPVLPAGGGLDPAVWQLAAGALWLVERPVGRGPARLVRLDAATGTRETMAELPGLLPDGIAVRPDGRGALVAGLRTAR